MQLKDLKPRKASFFLSSMKKEYFLRAVTPNDSHEIEKHVGKLEDSFKAGRVADLFKMAYILMEPESTLDFSKREVKFVDFEGNEKIESTGGYALFANLITGIDEQFAVLKACLVCMGLSDDYIDKLMEKKEEAISISLDEAVDKIEESKKKVVKKKKKKK